MPRTTHVTATTLARSLSDVLNRVVYRGERFVVQRRGRAIATLEPHGAAKLVPLRELAEALRGVPLPGEGFADDLEAIQADQPEEEGAPWPG